ncbi:MAG TPA: GNAT family N-acetyltransferase [Gemmatimonadales bacterium]
MILETPRLRIRELTEEDAPFIVELLNDEAFLRFIGDRQVRTLDDARAYVRNGPLASYAAHGYGLWLVESRDTTAPAGLCGLLRRDYLEDPDIGFAFLPAFRARGYGREAAEAVLAHARSRLGVGTVAAIVSPANTASISLLEKLGFRYERPVEVPGDASGILLYMLRAPAPPASAIAPAS